MQLRNIERAGIAVLLALALSLLPHPALACSGWIDCWLGMTERTEVRAQRDVEIALIQGEANAEITRIQGEADTRVKQAEVEVERVRQMQFQSEADRDIAIAQATAKAEEYKAMIAGLTSEKVTGIQSNANTQIAALQEQSKIAIEGIVQTSKTERWRVAFGWATLIVGLLVVGTGWLYWLRRNGAWVVVMLPETPTAQRLPWYSDNLEIVEVKRAKLPVRTKLTMPMVIALLILATGFVAIAWTVQWATSSSSERISQAIQAGAAALVPPIPPTTEAANSLPAFTLDLDGATGYQPQTINGWLNPKALDKMVEGNLVFVWLGSWWTCAFIAADYRYKPVGMGDVPQNPQDTVDIAHWNDLTFRQQQQVKKECAR